MALRESLNNCSRFGRVEIQPVSLARTLRKRFMGCLGDIPSSVNRRTKIYPGFHGTDASNHQSIFDRGLLIPGQGNELQVIHGAAHGQGVYTANVDAAWLSEGFCTEPRILICAVLDLGCVTFPGDAMVVSSSAHVVPLFEAVGSGKKDAELKQAEIARWHRPATRLSTKAQRHIARAAGNIQTSKQHP